MVAAMFLSWLAISNHCVLGLMRQTARTQAEHAHCHGGKIPGKESPTDSTECCKTLHASLPVKAEVKYDASKFQLQLFALVQVRAAGVAEPAPRVFIFDHGPPRTLSFAESVLQRSLFSHAPPLAV